jgi:hypothetical protein
MSLPISQSPRARMTGHRPRAEGAEPHMRNLIQWTVLTCGTAPQAEANRELQGLADRPSAVSLRLSVIRTRQASAVQVAQETQKQVSGSPRPGRLRAVSAWAIKFQSRPPLNLNIFPYLFLFLVDPSVPPFSLFLLIHSSPGDPLFSLSIKIKSTTNFPYLFLSIKQKYIDTSLPI